MVFRIFFFLKIDLCLEPWISQSILHQFQQSMTVLESSWRADFKYVPDLWICWRIDWDNWHWKRWRRNWFLKNFNFLQPQISQPKLHQIKHVGGVLESSWWADFKTAIVCQNWSRFHIEKGQKLLLQSKGGVL